MRSRSLGEAKRAAHAIVVGLILGWILAKVGERDLPGGVGRLG